MTANFKKFIAETTLGLRSGAGKLFIEGSDEEWGVKKQEEFRLTSKTFRRFHELGITLNLRQLIRSTDLDYDGVKELAGLGYDMREDDYSILFYLKNGDDILKLFLEGYTTSNLSQLFEVAHTSSLDLLRYLSWYYPEPQRLIRAIEESRQYAWGRYSIKFDDPESCFVTSPLAEMMSDDLLYFLAERSGNQEIFDLASLKESAQWEYLDELICRAAEALSYKELLLQVTFIFTQTQISDYDAMSFCSGDLVRWFYCNDASLRQKFRSLAPRVASFIDLFDPPELTDQTYRQSAFQFEDELDSEGWPIYEPGDCFKWKLYHFAAGLRD